MLLNDNELNARLESTDNLINRMRSVRQVSQVSETEPEQKEISSFLSLLNGSHRPSSRAVIDIPALPPSSENLIENLEDKIKTAQVNHNALAVLDDSLILLRDKLVDVQHAKDLSRIATDMEKILNGSRINERENNRTTGTGGVIIYKPIIVNESHYESVTVQE